MQCRDYIFQLSSGQAQEAGPLEQLAAWQHRLVCARCRAFTRNDAILQQALEAFKDDLQQPADTDSK